MELEPPPETVHIDDPLQPRGPWSFWKEALPGGANRWGIQLLFAWAIFEILTSTAWASHLKGLVGRSALANYWGELLTVRDIWELTVNGGLKDHPLGFWTPCFALLAMLWILWAGWQVQAGAVNAPVRARAWCWGCLDALLIAGAPLFLLGLGLTWILGGLASTGIQGLGWFSLVVGPLVRFSCMSTFMLQWWLCRIDRSSGSSLAWNLGGLDSLGRHLGQSFLRLWLHPVQWGSLILGGVVVRLGLHFLVFLLAWYLGGGTSLRLWIFLLLELLATVLAAWCLGWFLRLSALFWQQDFRVRQEVEALERMVEEGA